MRLAPKIFPPGNAGSYLTSETMLMEFIGVMADRYGSAEISSFLYSITRMHRPRVIVELGTGYGVSSFRMAQAVKENQAGHVWTVDNLQHFCERPWKYRTALAALRKTSLAHLSKIAPSVFYRSVSKELGLSRYISFLKRTIHLQKSPDFRDYPFFRKKVDLLFSDISHGPGSITGILSAFLPKMAPASSIFIDSASTYWPSYFFLEDAVSILNRRKMTEALEKQFTPREKLKIFSRKYSLIHLTYKGRKTVQNSTAWIKIEPRRSIPIRWRQVNCC